MGLIPVAQTLDEDIDAAGVHRKGLEPLGRLSSQW